MNAVSHRPRSNRSSTLSRTGVAMLLALAVALVWTASAQADGEAETVRVATLLPFVEDALRVAPGNAVVVASVRRSLHEPPRADVADLGNPHSPSLESLVGARPDVIVGDAALHARLRPQLARTGADVLLLDTSSVDATLAALESVGERVGGGASMKSATAATRAAIAERSLDEPIEALILFGAPGTFYVMTDRTWLGDLLEQLSFVNAAPEHGGNERFPGLVALSDEVVAGLSPQLVLLVAHGDPRAIQAALEKKIASGGAWAGLQKASTIHVLDPHVFAANPGLELARAADELVTLAPASVGAR